jgi:hypothetical protein
MELVQYEISCKDAKKPALTMTFHIALAAQAKSLRLLEFTARLAGVVNLRFPNGIRC